MFEVRLARPHELPEAAELVASRSPEVFDSKKLLEHFIKNKPKVFVAVHENRIVGTVTTRPSNYLLFFPQKYEVSNLAVHRQFEGKDVSLRLMETAVQDARRLRHRRMVFGAEKELLRYYEKVAKHLGLKYRAYYDEDEDFPARIEVDL